MGGVLDLQYSKNRKIKPELIFRYKVRAQVVANAVRRYLAKRENLKILNFGAAEGLTLLELNRLLPNNKITGIEYAEELIEQAPDLSPNIKLLQGDVTSLDMEIKKRKYDVVCALALLEHLPDPAKCIKEAASVLWPGGVFIASSPSPFWDKVSTKLGLLKEDQHEIEMTKKRMIDFTRRAGFKVLAYKRFMWAPISMLPYLKMNISPRTSLKLDKIIYSIKIFNWLFVNQVIICKK